MKFRKKPVVIEASQWFKNGDHPEDAATEMLRLELRAVQDRERRADRGGSVLRTLRDHLHAHAAEMNSHNALHDAYIALREAKEAMDPNDPATIDHWLRADWTLHAVMQRMNGRPMPEPYVPYDWPAARASRHC